MTITKGNRELIFFIIIGITVCLMLNLENKIGYKIAGTDGIRISMMILFFGVISSLFLYLMYKLCKLDSTSEGFWDVSEYAKCKGGPFFWQGDSELARECKALAETPEGKAALSSYNCPIGFNGQPNQPFYYTPLSNDQWENERCMDKPTCQKNAEEGIPVIADDNSGMNWKCAEGTVCSMGE